MAASHIEITLTPSVTEAFATLTERLGRVATLQEQIVDHQAAIAAELDGIATSLAEVLQRPFEVVETTLD